MAFWHKKHRLRMFRLEEIDTETLDDLIEFFDSMAVSSLDFDEQWTKRAKWARFLKRNPELMEVLASVLVPQRRKIWEKDD